MDLNRAIRLAVDTGDAKLGTDSARKISLGGGAKLIVLAGNLPAEVTRDLEHYCRLSAIPIVKFSGNSVELGTVCGKPFPVSAISVISEGNSDILKALDERDAGQATAKEEDEGS